MRKATWMRNKNLVVVPWIIGNKTTFFLGKTELMVNNGSGVRGNGRAWGEATGGGVANGAWHRFCVAGMVLRDFPTCFIRCPKLYCVTRAILLQGLQKMSCVFRGRCNTLETSIIILRGRGNTLDVSCCVFLRIALSGLHQVVSACKFRGRCRTWQAQHLVKIRRVWNVILHGIRSICDTLHFTLHTLFCTLNSLYFTLR